MRALKWQTANPRAQLPRGTTPKPESVLEARGGAFDNRGVRPARMTPHHSARSPAQARLSFLAALGVILAALSGASAATRIDLVIDEPFADRKAAWPVTTGVPFPRGKLTGAEHCRLLDDRGKEQLLQAQVSATWDAERKSVRWLTIDFIAEPGRKYALEYGDEIVRHAGATPLSVTQQPGVELSTGALRVEFSASGPTALRTIAADRNGDGRIDSDEVVAAGAGDGEHYYVDQSGRRFTSARDGADRRVVVEATGPVRACVRVDGFYTGPRGERIAKYRTRYHFFAGLPVIKVVDELAFIGSTKETRFADIGFSLDSRVKTAGRRVIVDASGEPGNQPLEVPWQAGTQSVASVQKTFRHYGNLAYEAAVIQTSAQQTNTLAQPERMGEWMQVSDDRLAITGSLRWFWQQFPKEWEATPNRLTLHFWSPRAGELDFGAAGIEQFFGAGGEKYLRAGQELRDRNPLERAFFNPDLPAIKRGAADGLGVNKHHEFWLHFAGASRRDEGAEYGRLAALPPLALASGAWNCSTDVFGPLAPRPNDSPAEAAVDRIFDLSRQAQDDFGDYGWWLFGAGSHYSYHWDAETRKFFADARRFEFHTYGKETQLWWNYLRSGERKFYDWAIPSENHWVDIAVSHMPTSIECDWRGGEPEHRTLHWRPGEWSIDSPTHYIRHHERAEAWLRGGAQFWASYHRTLETTTLAYYLTGDERYNDVVEYWRTYFGELAGVTSASADARPWYREQPWFRPTAAGEPAKSWAAMIRDYAPFHSGTRHEMTMFFSLATLYEHTWDPRVGQALRECADAFLDPAHATGTWRPQDSDLPAHAEAPSMGHFWVPALWKYTRVTQDPRMPDILARYFAAGYAADPFREFETVGVYSNSYLGYAYYFTRDARFLPLAAKELELLQPYANPLEKPDDIGQRIFNPYAPARTFAGVPRLAWALDAARKEGVRIGPKPLPPQRTAIALRKLAGNELRATLWGFEPAFAVVGPDGKPFSNFAVKTERFATDIQPFDRTLPKYEVWLHSLTIPATAPEGDYVFTPKLELAVLDWSDAAAPLWSAAQPLSLKLGEGVWLPIAADQQALKLESAEAASLRLHDRAGHERPGKVAGSTVTFDLKESHPDVVRIETATKSGWFRVVERAESACWVTPTEASAARVGPALQPLSDALHDPSKSFLPGRFGSAVQIVPKRALHIPDHVMAGGVKTPLFDERQGTIEFWIRKQWDERLSPIKLPNLMTNGLLTVPLPNKLKLDEWTHVALVWAPYRGDPTRTMTYTYIDGLDAVFYRSANWEGYSSGRASSKPKTAKRLMEFVSRAIAGTTYSIDELRISSVARYADLNVEYGPQQTFNPMRFTPPSEPFQPDPQTLLLMHFDDDLKAAVPEQLPPARLGE
jgi:hypothetical protein